MKKQVHVCAIYPNVTKVEDIYKLLRLDHKDELEYEFVMDNVHPDFIIVTELLYVDPGVHKRFAELYNDQITTIFIGGECVSPDLNLFDYAICYGMFLENDRVICHPYMYHLRETVKEFRNVYAGKIDSIKSELSKKVGFCNFVYSNPNGHKCREEIFHTINAYKKVDSLGSFLNNTGFRDGDDCSYYEKIRSSVDLKSQYKFTIAFENEISRGYTTEKVFLALEAHSIPIYWGNPEIGGIINEKAIINCHQYDNFQQVLERVKEIDQNDALWCQIVSEPWMTKEQEDQERRQIQKYYDFLDGIFLEKNPIALKRGSGTFANLYRNFFFGNSDVYVKSMAKFRLCMDWIHVHHQGKGLGSFFKDRAYKTVAIYGMADIGAAAYEELKECEAIETVYGIDQGFPPLPDDVKCFRLYEVNEDMYPDAVVTTVLTDQETIAENIQKQFHCDIYSITEIMQKILNEANNL